MKLEIINGSKELSGNKILNNINLSFDDNKIYAIVGENGSGKTLLLRALVGLMKLDEGEIFNDNKKIGKDIDFLQDVGLILGNMSLLKSYNAFDNLKILQSIDKEYNKEEILKALKVVGLDENKKKVSSYSLGMNQRLVFAQAILEEPKILLLDEPTNGMDENYTNKAKEKIISLKKEGRIIIVTSHDKYFIQDIADEIITLKKGSVYDAKNC